MDYYSDRLCKCWYAKPSGLSSRVASQCIIQMDYYSDRLCKCWYAKPDGSSSRVASLLIHPNEIMHRSASTPPQIFICLCTYS